MVVGDAAGSAGDTVTIPVEFIPGAPDDKPFGGDEIVHLEFALDFHNSPGLEFDSTDTNGDGLPDAIVFNPKGDQGLDYFALTLLNPETAAVDRVLRFSIESTDGGDRTLPASILMTISLTIAPRTVGGGGAGRLGIEPVDVRAFDLNGALYPVMTVAGVVHVDHPFTPTPEPTGPRQLWYDDDGCAITATHSFASAPLLMLVALVLAGRIFRRP